MPPLPRWFSDSAFLNGLHWFERQLAKLLALLLLVVILMAVGQLAVWAAQMAFTPDTQWFDGELITLLDRLLMVLIALEVLQNLTSVLRDHVVQIELVLVTALTALARKAIVLPPGPEKNPADLISLGLAVAAIAGAYWLVRQAQTLRRPSRRGPARGSQGWDR